MFGNMFVDRGYWDLELTIRTYLSRHEVARPPD